MRPKKHRAFTLIELLCVISILAVLVSVALPSLRTIRDRAGVTTCAGSHRASYDLMTAWAAEYKDYPGNNRCDSGAVEAHWIYERSNTPGDGNNTYVNGQGATANFETNVTVMGYALPTKSTPSLEYYPEEAGQLTDCNDPQWSSPLYNSSTTIVGYHLGISYGMIWRAGLMGNSANDWARVQCATSPHNALVCDANLGGFRNGYLFSGTWLSPAGPSFYNNYNPNGLQEVFNFGNGLWFGYNGPNVGVKLAPPDPAYPGPDGEYTHNNANGASGMLTAGIGAVGDYNTALNILGGHSGSVGGQAVGQTWGISLRDGGRHYGNNQYRPNGWYSVSDFAFLACPGLPGGREPHMGQELDFSNPYKDPNISALDRNYTFGDGHTSYISRFDRNSFTPSDKP